MCSNKSSVRKSDFEEGSQNKKQKTIVSTLLHKLLEESGLILKHPPAKCLATKETVHIIRNFKNILQKQFDYPRNISNVFNGFTKECQDLEVFKQYLFPNIVRQADDTQEEHHTNDSVVKILLNIPILQNKVIDYIFEKATDLAVENKCAPWIQMILKCISTLDTIENTEKITCNLINLLDIANERIVRLEIITAIPDIVGDQEHENIAAEMSRFLTEDHELTPAILDCLSYLCLSDDQYIQLQKKTLCILTLSPKCIYFSNFVNFVLMPGRMNEQGYLEAVHGLRNSLGWSTSVASSQEIATSQVLTASAIRNSIMSSKALGNAWLKTVSSCKAATDHKPMDILIFLILYSTTEERQKQIENLIKKHIKSNILRENLLDDAFEKYKPVFKEYLQHMIDLTNSLLKIKSDPLMESFASHVYKLMLSELTDSRQTIIAEMLQLGLDSKQCVMSILIILNNVATKDMSMLKPQSLQMLTLLDRMEGMTLAEIRAVMNLVCGLSYTYENSIIRDDIHMIIRKELSSSSPTIKIHGILAGVYAVKYLMACKDNEENTVDMPDDVSYSSLTYLSEGSLRDAAQIIELISRSTKQHPDLIAFFYDELSNIISTAAHINKHFISWLTDAVTNDLQQNFIVESAPSQKLGQLKLTMQYCLNADSEIDEMIAINIAGLAVDSKSEINVGIISPLFQLIQCLHYKQHEGNLSGIDALLGCAVVMPQFDVEEVEDMDHDVVANILDCLIHCVNWFRELLNAFATQTDEILKTKLLQRILDIQEIESLIAKILLKHNVAYKPPACTFDIKKYTGERIERKITKPQNNKQGNNKSAAPNENFLPETVRSQPTQINGNIKTKLDSLQNLPLRNLSLKLLRLFNNDLSDDSEPDSKICIKSFNFLLKSINIRLEAILLSNVKRKTFHVNNETYEPEKAEECAKSFFEVLPKTMENLKLITSYIENHSDGQSQNESGFMLSTKIINYLECVESIYKLLTIYLRWVGFRNKNHSLLKSSLNIISNNSDNGNVTSLKDLTLQCAKYFQIHEKYCIQLSTAVSLIELLRSIQEYSDSKSVLKILRDLSNNFLSQIWKTPDGAVEKGIFINQSIDRLSGIYFLNSEIFALKSISEQLTSDIQYLKGRNDTLISMKCINKSNFPILFRNLGNAVLEATKLRLDKGLTNSEHLDLWKDVMIILKYMSDIAKTLESSNNLSAFFKKSFPILKIFMTHGVPIMELQLKSKTQEVIEILKILQQSTRFLQSLCCHSRLKKDSALLSKVPFMRQLLESIIYKVKAALAANNCSEAFWMGNLKNKDIHGEVIATQQSIEEESVEDCDEQMPDDDESEDSDDEMLNPDSKSVSDIL